MSNRSGLLPAAKRAVCSYLLIPRLHALSCFTFLLRSLARLILGSWETFKGLHFWKKTLPEMLISLRRP